MYEIDMVKVFEGCGVMAKRLRSSQEVLSSNQDVHSCKILGQSRFSSFIWVHDAFSRK